MISSTRGYGINNKLMQSTEARRLVDVIEIILGWFSVGYQDIYPEC